MNSKALILLLVVAVAGVGLVLQTRAPEADGKAPHQDAPPATESTHPTDPAVPHSTNEGYYQQMEEQLLAGWHDDLFTQPRMVAYSRLARQYGFAPGTTRWHVSQLAPQPQRFASPQAVLATFVSQHIESGLGTDVWEVVTRLGSANTTATGAVLLWGYQDDAIAGVDYRLTIESDAAGWYLSSLDERYHCRRGVSDGGLCL